MPFPQELRAALLVKSGRRCCLCMRFCGTKIEVDHIIQEADGGPNTEDNGIPLCFDCHAEVKHYNPRHPRGTKFQPEELRAHRDRLFRWIAEKGPLVFDAILGGVVSDRGSPEPDTAPALAAIPRVNLEHKARVGRYYRMLSRADEYFRAGKFVEAAREFSAAFLLADSDGDLSDFAVSGNYHQRKLRLWESYLEHAWTSRDAEAIRAAAAMGIDEDEIQRIRARERYAWAGLGFRDYFYLFLQEAIFVSDARFQERRPVADSLTRISHFFDIMDDPFMGDKDHSLVGRIKDIRQGVHERMKSLDEGPDSRRTES